MKYRANALLATAALICLIPAAAFAIDPYLQDFEAMDPASPTVLGDEGWLVYGNVFEVGTGNYLYGYGPFPAPNNPAAPAFCNLVVGEGGAEQGDNQLSVFSDYENLDHQDGDLIESNVYREMLVTPADVGKTWIFEFQAKMGDLVLPSTAHAFIKTLDPFSGYATTNFVTVNTSTIPAEWNGYSLALTIDPSLVGQLFQIGFVSEATLYQPSAIIYDNVWLHEAVSAVPDAAIAGASLAQNYPNPFNPSTRIGFNLEQPGNVQIAVYDLAGRLVRNLVNESMTAGDHYVVWNGTTESGAAAPAGQYSYVMRTAKGQMARSMILVK
jgi:hypothetical protein